MTITVRVEISKEKMKNFEELEETAREIGREVGRKLVVQALEGLDLELMAQRDVTRYRSKGLQKTCIKTTLGPIEFQRRVYVDQAVVEGKRCVHLLDQELGVEKEGLMSEEVCQLAASAVCESSYRGAAKLVREATGMHISPQGVWNLIQKLGKRRGEQVERYGELAAKKKGAGKLVSKIIYEENDGIWLKLQGQSREEHGATKEMKVGIAYDGVRWREDGSGKKRRQLDSKIAYASFEAAKEFRRKKEGLVASRFCVDEIELRVINGDGAKWIQKQAGVKSIGVLDEFHRNKKILECVKNREFAALLRKHLYAKDVDTMFACLEAQINSTTDPGELSGLKELQQYYTENREALLGYYDRGKEIPATRAPGEIHHARLGSMESNVFTLIGNRMKGGRACWSIGGANNLALLLCLHHTVGFEGLFARLEPQAEPEEEWVDPLPGFGAGKVPQREGHGYEFWATSRLAGTEGWLKKVVKNISISNTNNF